MANKRQILGAFSRLPLQQLVSSHELEVKDRRSKEALAESLMAARRIKIEDVLGTLSLAELTDLGKKLRLPPGPRQKSKLIAHLLAGKVVAAAGGAKKAPARKAKTKATRKASRKKTTKKKAAKKASKKKTTRRKKTSRRTVAKVEKRGAVEVEDERIEGGAVQEPSDEG